MEFMPEEASTKKENGATFSTASVVEPSESPPKESSKRQKRTTFIPEELDTLSYSGDSDDEDGAYQRPDKATPKKRSMPKRSYKKTKKPKKAKKTKKGSKKAKKAGNLTNRKIKKISQILRGKVKV